MNLLSLWTGIHPRRTKTVFAGLLFAALLSSAGLALPPQENADKIIARVRGSYEKLEALSADFQKDYTWALAGETQTMTGKLYLKKGDRYRIETEAQTIVTDGKTVWTYSADKQQVFIDNMTKSQENPLPRDLLIKYTNDFKAEYVRSEKFDQSDCHVVRLRPRQEDDSFAKSVTVWVDKKNWIAVKIEQIDLNENLTIYKLQNFAVNPALEDQLFTFKIPGNVEVVDWRNSEK
ncbi:outer membrane lipoprotein carrier protein LolA [candidate division KSB1 bacterium]|nr:MAG: outer membrane lipoprotein carrier protein LolA [candidate division KSB1 bacterium]MBC6946363.1 outer membrane lipoprotein carrier protein LolA [candidate division KSB1 bacterium]MCE7943742.1 outer membrane lipoprotein carrier protein LolA [Chlorobi bacterium CHB1]MDL1874902.1 outer membrane lipoprotein chaperone LolA [Cytophagia bacterium CHB2]